MSKIRKIISNLLIKLLLKLNPEFIVTKDTDEVTLITNALKADRHYIISNLAKLKKKPFSDGVYFSSEFNELVPLTNEYINNLLLVYNINSIIKKYNIHE